ncbi:hypothetical protein GJ496_004768 [Pomphorhynchus laevis]|nr:hypothetical protein GJ496_004768 [Pomphorhynchus laevis]
MASQISNLWENAYSMGLRFSFSLLLMEKLATVTEQHLPDEIEGRICISLDARLLNVLRIQMCCYRLCQPKISLIER